MHAMVSDHPVSLGAAPASWPLCLANQSCNPSSHTPSSSAPSWNHQVGHRSTAMHDKAIADRFNAAAGKSVEEHKTAVLGRVGDPSDLVPTIF